MNIHKNVFYLLGSVTIAFCLLGLPLSSWAADENNCETESAVCDESKVKDQPGRMRLLAGPEQVENRLDIDSNQVTPLFPSSFARGYFNWKDRIQEENGVGIGGDYSFAYLDSTESLGADDAFGGMYRLFGTWEATSDGKGNSGTLIWKVEHRHAYGSNIPPGSLGFETGYIGLFLPPFSDQGTRLTNLYWRQRMKGGDLVFVGGFVDRR